jgi:hypothetical protein
MFNLIYSKENNSKAKNDFQILKFSNSFVFKWMLNVCVSIICWVDEDWEIEEPHHLCMKKKLFMQKLSSVLVYAFTPFDPYFFIIFYIDAKNK